MIIDSHTHIGFGGAITASVEELLASMGKAGIDKALVFSGRLNNCLNDVLLEKIEPHQGILYGVGYGSPDLANIEVLDRLLRERRLVALKFYTGYDYFYPADPSIRPLLELCQFHGVPAIFHTGDCYRKAGISKLKYAHPLAVDDLAAEMPKLRIIMAHIGNPWVIDAAAVCYSKDNVWADCSGFVCGGYFPRQQRNEFAEQIRYFLNYVEAPEKLLFGSDWPISGQSSYLNALDFALRGNSKKMGLATCLTAQELFHL